MPISRLLPLLLAGRFLGRTQTSPRVFESAADRLRCPGESTPNILRRCSAASSPDAPAGADSRCGAVALGGGEKVDRTRLTSIGGIELPPHYRGSTYVVH